MTSLIDGASANNITKRSRPIPRPPVGGKPRSKAPKKSSSTSAASSVPVDREDGREGQKSSPLSTRSIDIPT